MTAFFGLACATTASSQSKAPGPVEADAEHEAAEEEPSATAGWSEAEPTSASAEETERPKREKGRVLVTWSGPAGGRELNFDFMVNGTRMDGVFVVPSGQNFTFALPAGSVVYSVAECGSGGGSFELPAGGSVTLVCTRTGQGDCCGTEPEEQPMPSSRKHRGAAPSAEE